MNCHFTYLIQTGLTKRLNLSKRCVKSSFNGGILCEHALLLCVKKSIHEIKQHTFDGRTSCFSRGRSGRENQGLSSTTLSRTGFEFLRLLHESVEKSELKRNGTGIVQQNQYKGNTLWDGRKQANVNERHCTINVLSNCALRMGSLTMSLVTTKLKNETECCEMK